MRRYIFLIAVLLFSAKAFAQPGDGEATAKLRQQADAYDSLALKLTYEDFVKKAGYFKKARALYKQAGARFEEAETLCELSIIYNGTDDIDTSIAYARQAISIKKKIKRNDLFKEYAMMGLNLRVLGKYKDALAYAIAAERTAETHPPDKQWMSILYDLLGTIYSELKYYDTSVEYYKKAIAVSEEIDDAEGVYAIKINTARGLFNRGRLTQALDILNSGYSYKTGTDCNVEFASLYILIYCELKQFAKARPYYNELIACSRNKAKNHIEQEKIYYAIIHYLIKTGQADKTYAYINELKKQSAAHNDLLNLSQLERVQYQSDSATGNFTGAFEHLKNYKRLNDSLFNMNSTKQFADMQLKYETEKKDKNIKLLQQQGELQTERINNEIIIRNVFIASLVILFIILGLLYSRYCIKQRNNKALEAKQEEINRKNIVLQHLVDEKEWLLKEIHHRVKNNLQIVISLLNTQSAYLDNEDALLAIQNSQNRMHAMSLIHQKLYQTENLSSIDMGWYIKELVGYLMDCFGTESKIRVEVETDDIALDVAQAVPLGLILNEAISNAIKYAFPGKKGIISISFKRKNESEYLLTITDNGIGLPDNFKNEERDSLGMNLMNGLALQLDGEFNIVSNNGVTITINFIKRRAEV